MGIGKRQAGVQAARATAVLCLCTGLVLFGVRAGLHSASRSPVRAKQAMVVTDEDHATRVGLEVLKNGGNAVDAAVAVGLALAVTHPPAGNLGGGGFMLIRTAEGESVFFDFRERAPAAASSGMYLDSEGEPTRESVVGYRAVGVPGTVRGLELAWRKYGTKPWNTLVRPATELAEKGFPISYGLAQSLRSAAGKLEPFADSRRIFLHDGKFYEPGDRLIQPELAATLRRIESGGADEFYLGETARLLAADIKRNGGLITLEDLKNYAPLERQPLRGTYRGYEILGAPPPSSGGAGIIQMLNILEGSGYAKHGAGSAATIHYVAEAMRLYFADRAAYFGDPDFVKIPLGRLLSKEYAAERRGLISEAASESAKISGGVRPGYESAETTHYAIVDKARNVVGVTYTLNSLYGSGVTAAGTGVLLNNEMDDFTAVPGRPNQLGLLQSEGNRIEPGKRPLSSMSPTIVVRDGKPVLVVGAAGGPRIISAVLQVILNVIDFKMNVRHNSEDRRIAADRPHHRGYCGQSD